MIYLHFVAYCCFSLPILAANLVSKLNKRLCTYTKVNNDIILHENRRANLIALSKFF